MLLSLEVLQAKYGDCLLLHYGVGAAHQVIVIDGGPAGVYKTVLKPRLTAIKNALSPGQALPLSMVMVSHMDDDHVNGILALTQDMLDLEEENEPVPFNIGQMWFNTFDDIIGNRQIPHVSSIAASTSAANLSNIPVIKDADHSISAVISSTGQGRQLRNNAAALSAQVNKPFTRRSNQVKLVRGDSNAAPVPWSGGLTITVLHPNEQRLVKYEQKWDADLQKALDAGDDSITIASIVDKDKSPFNLSSIVCLVELGDKKMLLTGDSRSDDILEGLRQNNLLDGDGKLHVDILKLPHHGSVRNASDNFYQQVTADHYVVSANGKYDNPDQALLDLLVRDVSHATLHFTNKINPEFPDLKTKMAAFVQEVGSNGSELSVQFRSDQKTSFVINLDAPLNI